MGSRFCHVSRGNPKDRNLKELVPLEKNNILLGKQVVLSQLICREPGQQPLRGQLCTQRLRQRAAQEGNRLWVVDGCGLWLAWGGVAVGVVTVGTGWWCWGGVGVGVQGWGGGPLICFQTHKAMLLSYLV